MSAKTGIARRPLKSRQTNWAKILSKKIAATGLKPNHISILSIVFVAIGGALLLLTNISSVWVSAMFFVLSAMCVQLRLLCNLLDGMMAVEHGLKTSSGEIFNDMPDRFADLFIIIPIGYTITSIPYSTELTWLAGTLSILTAYVRVLGNSAGTTHYFLGPMAKQHRMALVTIALFVSALTIRINWHEYIMYTTLLVISIGCIITIARRTYRIIFDIEKNEHN